MLAQQCPSVARSSLSHPLGSLPSEGSGLGWVCGGAQGAFVSVGKFRFPPFTIVSGQRNGDKGTPFSCRCLHPQTAPMDRDGPSTTTLVAIFEQPESEPRWQVARPQSFQANSPCRWLRSLWKGERERGRERTEDTKYILWYASWPRSPATPARSKTSSMGSSPPIPALSEKSARANDKAAWLLAGEVLTLSKGKANPKPGAGIVLLRIRGAWAPKLGLSYGFQRTRTPSGEKRCLADLSSLSTDIPKAVTRGA